MRTDIQSPNPSVTPLGATQAAVPNDDAGFRPVPTRIQDLAPIVVDGPDSETRTAVVETLSELSEKVATVHRTAAEAFMSQGMYDEALPHLEAATTFAPDNLEYHNQYGFVCYLTGDDDSASTAFERVLQSEPNQVDALFNLGMVSFGREQYESAASCFERVVALTPGDAEAWNNLGACLCQGGRAQDGIGCFRKALEIDPQNADAVANLQSMGA